MENRSVPGNRGAERFVRFVVRLVNGYYCRNCADVELAKKGMDPAHPGREYAGGEVYVPPPAERQLGVNEPEQGATIGGRLNLHA